MTNILRIDTSARTQGSASRELGGRLIERITAADPSVTVTHRDLADGVPLLSEATLLAMWTPADQQTDEQKAHLQVADEYIRELMDADAVVIGLPVYNFGPPASLKAWADLVARAGTTFRYTETGPEGLVGNKPAYIVYASGGVPAGSPMDQASTWLTTFLGFLGITDVKVIAAEGLNMDPEGALAKGRQLVDDAALPTFA